MNDTEQRKYYRAGIKAAWESLDPHKDDACYEAWGEYRDGNWQEVIDPGAHVAERALIHFAWGWKWASDRFRDPWIGVPANKRGVGMEVLWK